MRVLVCGGRDYADRDAVYAELDALAKEHGWLTIIEGGAKGADRMGREWAHRGYYGVVTVQPDWGKHGRAAGPMRNTEMLERGKPDLVLAFPGGKGTADMMQQAVKANVMVRAVGDWGQ